MFKVIVRATNMAQDIVRRIATEKDIAVDATLGNGNDTIFLSSILPYGKVYSFEIQHEAVTRFMQNNPGIKNAVLINDGHENMDSYISENVKAVMFNLGYLPGGDRSIVTLPNTTCEAVKKGLKLLSPGGIMTIVAYTGHRGGMNEACEVLNLVRGLSPRKFSVMESRFTNGKEQAPLLIVIEKNDSCHEDI